MILKIRTPKGHQKVTSPYFTYSSNPMSKTMKPTVATVGMATGRVRDGLGWNGPPPTPKLSTGPRPRVDIRVEIIPRPRPLRSPLRVSLDVRLRDALSLCAAPVRRRHASATLRRRRASAPPEERGKEGTGRWRGRPERRDVLPQCCCRLLGRGARVQRCCRVELAASR